MAWHRAATGDPVIALSALEWSLPAMRGAVRRLAVLGAADPATVLALINDAIWAVTIVDAAMVRYHPEVYERVLAAGPMADRQVIEESLAGLRFVRNQIHDEAMLAELVEPGRAQRGAGQAGLPDWTWKPPPGLRPSVALAPKRGRRPGNRDIRRSWPVIRSARRSNEPRRSSTASPPR